MSHLIQISHNRASGGDGRGQTFRIAGFFALSVLLLGWGPVAADDVQQPPRLLVTDHAANNEAEEIAPPAPDAVSSRMTPLNMQSAKVAQPQSFDRVHRLLSDADLRRQRRIEDLQRYLDTLDGLLEQAAQAANARRQTEPLPELPVHVVEEKPETSQPSHERQDHAGSTEANKEANKEAEKPRPAIASLPLKPLTTSPVDRFALGNNLFGTSQYDLALETYRSIDASQLPEEQRRWLAYQIACCHHRLGATSEAKKRYREIANVAEPDTVAKQARWWLDALQSRRRLESSLQGLDDSLQLLQSQWPGAADE